MLLLYRKCGVPHFLSRLDNNIQIVLGDLNINCFNFMLYALVDKLKEPEKMGPSLKSDTSTSVFHR